jgi:transposase
MRAKEYGLDYNNASGMSDNELYRKLTSGTKLKCVYKLPDYEYVHREMAKNGVTLNLLWLEYCESCRKSGEIPYQSTQFNKYYADYVLKNNSTMRIDNKPGDIMQVDWAGKHPNYVDEYTGEVISAHLFVGVLAYSGYAYVEAFPSEKEVYWIAAHVNAYRYFGGVTRILRPDNLKTGITANTKDETIIQKSYQEMAEHYGTAVIPARIRKPRDKSRAEGTVSIATNKIIGALRNEIFYSLAELNTAIREKLELINHSAFQKKEGSRYELFQEEKHFLLPLPKHHFELADWKQYTVQSNYHIGCDHQNYSVPFEYIGRRVDVRVAKETIEVFFDSNRVCSHPRLHGRPNQYSTNPEHMPPNHQKNLEWDGDRFRKWAKKYGENTLAVIEVFLNNFKIEQQSYKSCNALLHLADKYSAKRLESACERAFTYTSRPNLKSIQTILKSGQDKLPTEEQKQPLKSSQYGFTRGADYYGGSDND